MIDTKPIDSLVSHNVTIDTKHARFEGPGVLFYASDNDDAEPMKGSAMDDEVAVGFLQHRLASTLAARILRVDPAVEALDQFFIRDDSFRNFSANAADDDAMHVGAETLRRNTFLIRPVYAGLNEGFGPA